MPSSLEARLAILERRQRRLVRGTTALVVILAAAVFMAQTATVPRALPGDVRGTRVVLVDPKGEVRGLLTVEDGAALIELRDDRGVTLRLGSSQGAGSLQYRDEDGVVRDMMHPHPEVQLLR